MKTLMVQPAPRVDKILDDGTELTQLPYPFYGDEAGLVQNQQFWSGKPLEIVGFQRDLSKNQVDLEWREAWHRPARAIGMYVVTRDADGGMGTHLTAVDEVRWYGDDEEKAPLLPWSVPDGSV